MGVRRLAVVNGPNIFQMFLVLLNYFTAVCVELVQTMLVCSALRCRANMYSMLIYNLLICPACISDCLITMIELC